MGDHAEAFALFDRDNDGKINAMDMESLIRAVGANPTERDKIFLPEPLQFP